MPKKTKKSEEQKPKTQELTGMTGPGVEPLKVPAIDLALSVYVPVRERRMRETPKEVEAKGKVVAAFHAHLDELPRNDAGEPFYRWGDKRWVLRPGKEKLVSAADEDEELD